MEQESPLELHCDYFKANKPSETTDGMLDVAAYHTSGFRIPDSHAMCSVWHARGPLLGELLRRKYSNIAVSRLLCSLR